MNIYKIAIKKNRFILKTTIHSKTKPRGNLSISDEQFEYQFSLSQTFKKFYFNPIPKRQCNSFGEGRRSVLVINQEREEKRGEKEREEEKGRRKKRR